ncbi:glycoside hydrolase family 3 protein [Agilicoccus flavus]|uniref:glycoside hydrolase family 3 protein n=1 Tax=Agilicoccus flavus TaxID=2775968 RepID=UPI001CF6771E|nr:glycoside hydrolase family 3 C-terminal domain-containing protein [Agilicoccus flavus]
MTSAPPAHQPDLDSLVGRLDLDTKVRLLTGASMFTLHGEPSIGLAEMAFSDGPTGVRGLKFSGGGAAALLPNATLLAAHWSEDVAREVGRILAAEAMRRHIHVVLGPTINLHRTPLGGRLFEAYSEDPLLTGRLAAAYVEGLQGEGVGACLKHLVGNESETERNFVDSVIDEATLREVYLLPFEIALGERGAWTVMAAYNDVNGAPSTENGWVQNDVLRGEWGFDGLVMSDWFAARTTAPTANGGLDLVMPGPEGPWGERLVAAVRAGEVEESVVDDHVRRLLLLADRVGALGDRAGIDRSDQLAPDAPQRREALRRLAAGGMTVLRNDGVLPLPADAPVTLVGRHASETVCMGGGSAHVEPPHEVSVVEGLRSRVADLVVADGVDVRARPVPAPAGVLDDPHTGEPGMHVRLEDADGEEIFAGHLDGTEYVVGFDEELPRPAARIVLTARVRLSGRLRIGVIGTGAWTVRAGGPLHDVVLRVDGDDPGEALLNPPSWTEDVEAGTDVLLEASAWLTPPNYAPREGDAPEGTDFLLDAGNGLKALVASPSPRLVDDIVAEAAEAARDRTAVVVVGLTPEQEAEGSDKSTLALPGEQGRLVREVAAAAARTVVVVNAATPVLMPWRDEVDAIVVAGLPGQEGGDAVAAALTGEIEPAGRLVTSFPAADGASPAWDVEPTDGRLVYAEGPFVGYRGYAAGRADPPAFWFGEGLGYGSWEYGEAELAEGHGEAELAEGDREAKLAGSDGEAELAEGRGESDAGVAGPRVRVPVTNSSERDSREVVQVYWEPSEADQPTRLVGWADAVVPAGDTATVEVTCDPRMWRRWDVRAGAWTTLGGGTLLVARGLGDVRARLPMH